MDLMFGIVVIILLVIFLAFMIAARKLEEDHERWLEEQEFNRDDSEE